MSAIRFMLTVLTILVVIDIVWAFWALARGDYGDTIVLGSVACVCLYVMSRAGRG